MSKSGYRLEGVCELLQARQTQRTNTCWTLVYVREGAGMCLLGQRMVCLDENDIILIPPRFAFSFMSSDLGDEYNASLDAMVVSFEEHWLEDLLKVFRMYGEMVMRLREITSPVMIQGTRWLKLSDMLATLAGADPHTEAVTLLEIISLLSDSSGAAGLAASQSADLPDAAQKLERIERYISCHFLQRITLDEIAAYSGMNRTYFCLFFKKHYGRSLTDHLNSMRIDLACNLLTTTGRTVADIAAHCGFATLTYFNRIFMKYCGVSPRTYRQKVNH